MEFIYNVGPGERDKVNLLFTTDVRILFAALGGSLALCAGASSAQPTASAAATNEIRIVGLQGRAEVSPAGATAWVPARTNQILHPFDRLRTGADSRVAVRWSNQSVVMFGALTELEILPPHQRDAQSGLHLIRGVVSFFHRDRPGRIRVVTRGALAGVEGTEFALAVTAPNGTERTTLSVIDGKVRFGNQFATLVLTNGEQAVAEAGAAPVRTAGFVANNILQWCFYYPAVLDPSEVPFTADERNELARSLAAYRTGDLLDALAKYPASRAPASDAERVYYAALLLSVGQVERAEDTLSALSERGADSRPQRLAAALRRLVAAVKLQPAPSAAYPELATEFLAGSYYEQSRAVPETSLEEALKLARSAAQRSPEFGFAWERVAELEFSFGRTSRALEALDRSLALAPRNAQALALKGFLLAAQNRTREAVSWFDHALAVDSSLGNAWLGRGLCRIHRGDAIGGREDLLVAAAIEPQRAELRSYLGKAYANAGDYPRAFKELQLAKRLDPNDPTAWLYSALLKQQDNRINEAIRDLEKSEELNDNRSVYRSRLLLDQDRAVRSANLAAMYRDAGMSEVALREASRAVNYDYGNYSAHLFLANSYLELRDPNLVNVRYETPAEAEFLLANLLAPVSAGMLSPTVSQQEYSPLFERNRLGLVSSTEYLSRGAWTESGAQYGICDNFSYDLEGFYRSDPGQRVNDDIEERQILLTLKGQLTPQDMVYFRVQQTKIEMGNVAQYYDPNSANTTFRGNEKQEPILELGYHHEWSPGVHTLFYFARIDDTASFTNQFQPTIVTSRLGIEPGVSPLVGVQGITMHQHYVDKLELYSGELQQIWQQPAHNTIIGARLQYGHFHTTTLQNTPSGLGSVFLVPAADQDFTSPFKRVSVYGYHQWQIADPLQLIGGVSYDWLRFPENFRYAPISSTEQTADEICPKAGLIWTPTKGTAVRFAYTRSLAGASLDQSIRLEPPQVAGFVQSFRSLIPESVVGGNAGARFETYGLSLEQKFSTGTYLGISGELLYSDLRRTVGAFDVLDEPDYAVPSGLREQLDYQEQALLATANQLIGKHWSLGVTYRLSRAVLKSDFVGVPHESIIGVPVYLVDFEPRQRTEGVLHRLGLSAVYNHPCGFFARGDALWYHQNNKGYSPAEPGDDFWQLNALVGYRFCHRTAELSAGVLNITDQDYHLNPLNLYNELPRRRTLAVRFQLAF